MVGPAQIEQHTCRVHFLWKHPHGSGHSFPELVVLNILKNFRYRNDRPEFARSRSMQVEIPGVRIG